MKHSITVDGRRYQFTMKRARHGPWVVTAPGVGPFEAKSLAEAKNVLRSVYSRAVP